MEDTQRFALLNELNGLETAKHLIDRRINEIMENLQMPANIASPRNLRPLPIGDPTVLGRDALGRIKRKRNISPELREAKRQLINKARQQKLDALKAQKQGDLERPPTPAATVIPVSQPLTAVGGTKNKR